MVTRQIASLKNSLKVCLPLILQNPGIFLAHRYLCHWKTRFKGNSITDFCPVININSKPEGKKLLSLCNQLYLSIYSWLFWPGLLFIKIQVFLICFLSIFPRVYYAYQNTSLCTSVTLVVIVNPIRSISPWSRWYASDLIHRSVFCVWLANLFYFCFLYQTVH